MRNFIIFYFLIVMHSVNSIAQQKLTEFNVKISKPHEAYICADTTGTIGCILHSNKEIEVNYLNPDFTPVSSNLVQKIKGDKSEKILGALLRDNATYIYTYSVRLHSISCIAISRPSGEAVFSKVKVLTANDEFLRAFEMENRFYFLYVPRHTNQLRVLVMDGKEGEEISYNVEMPTFYAALSRNNDMLNVSAESNVGIEDIRYDLENNVKSTYPNKKLYHFHGKIYFTFDEPAITHLIIVDPISKTSEYKKLNFTLDKGNTSGNKQGNSFIYQNRFFRASLSPEQLNIIVLNLDSMNLIKSYNLFPEFDIDIANGPLIQEGGVVGRTSDEKIIKTSNQFFKRLQDGNLAIAANKIDDTRFEMEVGSFDMYSNYGGRPGMGGGPTISFGMGMGMGGVGFGNPGMMGMGYPYGGGLGYPYYSGFPGYYPYSSVQRVRVVYFKSLLSSNDFSHIDGKVPMTMKDKITDYEDGAFRYGLPDVIRITPYQNNLLMGYYQKSMKRFNIVGFQRK